MFGYTRQAYYDSRNRVEYRLLSGEVIINLVKEVRLDMPRMGAKKLHIKLTPKLCAMNINIGRDAFASLLSENNMLIRRKRSRCRTTFSRHRFYKYPNLIRGLVPTAPNQLWVSDITYIAVGNGFIYLSLITDAYSHKIVGWNLAQDLGAANALKALKGALKALPRGIVPIHHSDRGVQYCCDDYVSELEKYKLPISMTENGDPLENALAERVNGILKTEWIYDAHFGSFGEAKTYVKRIIGLYNSERPHQSISYLTPNVVHNAGVNQIKEAPQRKWKNYYPKRNAFANSAELTTFE